VVQHAQDVARPLAWTQGTLAFADVPLEQAARDIARWYGIELRIPDATLRAVPVTGSIGHEPAREVVTELTTILGVRAEWLGSDVVELRR
jgi:ferric-dicitrate binding protein FerR (iron transport regulator)